MPSACHLALLLNKLDFARTSYFKPEFYNFYINRRKYTL